MEFKIEKLSQLNQEQAEAAVSLFVDGFYNIFQMAVSKDKKLLQQLFTDAFDVDMVYICLCDDEPVGFLGLGDMHKRPVQIKKETCQMLLGKLKGALIYKQMGGMLHEITVHDADEGYIDYLTTSVHHRGKGIATKLIEYLCDELPFKRYSLEVLSKNLNAKKLYEHIGFTFVRAKKNPLILLSGLGYPIVMMLETGK